MRRRTFLKQLGMVATTGLAGSSLHAARSATTQAPPELATHKIDKIEFVQVQYRWPRLVGKNSRSPTVHGQHMSCGVVKLHTDQGAMGWGLTEGNARVVAESLQGKAVSDLIHPALGILNPQHKPFDFAVHDLAGVILDQPVYQLLGAHGPRETLIYSGMIYFDELEPPEKPAGIAKVLENCRWDLDYGYRQLKVKVGRGNRWYPGEQGLRTDIQIVKEIHGAFKDRGVVILVDANDGYTLDDTIRFLEGIGDTPLFWFEEPFREDRKQSGQLRDWMNANGFEETYLADGESDPDPALFMKLAKEEILDVCLHDINSHGFTRWRELMPKLSSQGTLASPHTWGSRLKTHYSAHLAAGLGNCCTIEGVTCESDDIDYGHYRIIEGTLHVPGEPGFGMKLLV